PEQELRSVPQHPPVVAGSLPEGALSGRGVAVEPRRVLDRRAARRARAQCAAAEEHPDAARGQLAPRRSAVPRRAREEVLAVPVPSAAAWLASCALTLAPAPSASLVARSDAPPFSGTEFAITAATFDLADHPMLSGLTLATGSITAPREEKPPKP